MVDLKSGTNPSDVKKAKRTEMTLGELFNEYVSEHLIPKEKRVDSAKAYYEMYVGELPPPEPGKKKRVKLPGCVNWHNRKISSITTEEIKRFINGLATKGKSPDNANRVLTLLKSMYERARDWKIFKGENPTDGVSKFKTRSRQRFLQPDEAPRFFLSLSMEANQDIQDYVILSLLTGARKSNVHAMRWVDLNLSRALWTLPDVFTKNGDPLTIPLMPEAVEILQRRKPNKAAEYVFPGTGKSGHIENSRSGWDRVLDRDEVIQLAERIKAAGGEFEYSFDDPEKPGYDHLGVLLKLARQKATEMQIDTNGTRMIDLRPHDLRRTLGSWQASTGSSLLMIGKTLGHKSQAATAIYAHLNIDPVRQAMATATSALLQAGKMKESGKLVSLKSEAQ
jgi:integrase